MSEQCHVCGPVKHEAPTVICAPCALLLSFGWDQDEVRRNGKMKVVAVHRDNESIRIDVGPANSITVTGPAPPEGGTLTVVAQGRVVELDIAADETNAQVAQRLAEALNASEMRSVVPVNCCQRCGGLMLTSSAGDRCAAGCP